VKDPAPLKVKEVEVKGRRCVISLNEEEKRDLSGVVALASMRSMWGQISGAIEIAESSTGLRM